MKDIVIQENVKSMLPSPLEDTQQEGGQGETFFETLKGTISEVNRLHQEADKAVEDLSTGKETDIHNTMIALEKAEVSFQMMMQVRNKIISAYETIMRTGL